jgi:CBS domain-containing protein
VAEETIMRVEHLMRRNVRACTSEDTLKTAARIMWEQDCGCAPVVEQGDGGRVVGMITDRDICMGAYTQDRPLGDITVKTVMSKHVCSCRPTDSLAVVLKVMEANQIRRVPVVDDEDRLLGLVSLADIAREASHEHTAARKQVTDAQVGEAIEAICSPRPSQREIVAAA